MVNLTSVASDPISTIKTPSAIISPAPTPAIAIPRIRSVFGSTINLVSPSWRFRVAARPEAPHGNLRTLISRFCSLASASVNPHQGVPIRIKAVANSVYKFVDWSGDVSADGVIELGGNLSVIAKFSK